MQTTVLSGDPNVPGPYAIEIRVPPHTRIAAHRHRDNRTAIVVSGVWYFGYGQVAGASEEKALPPGSFYTEPANLSHFVEVREPVTIQVSGTGPSGRVFRQANRQHEVGNASRQRS